jgi:hypothetical protein
VAVKLFEAVVFELLGHRESVANLEAVGKGCEQLREYHQELSTLMADNFRVVKI